MTVAKSVSGKMHFNKDNTIADKEPSFILMEGSIYKEYMTNKNALCPNKLALNYKEKHEIIMMVNRKIYTLGNKKNIINDVIFWPLSKLVKFFEKAK